ncbi:MAG: SIMPL domain-containing protein [Ilumatobacteraceae bacterium]
MEPTTDPTADPAGEPAAEPTVGPSAGAANRTPKTRWLAAVLGGAAIGMMAVGAVAIIGRNDPGTTSAGRVDKSSEPTTMPVESPPPTDPGAGTTVGPITGVVARTITVSGNGSVTVKPDTATLNLGVQSDRPTATAALDETNRSATALIAALKQSGIADDDIVTSGLNIYPRYNNGNTISGYTASSSVTVTVRKIDRTGPTIDVAAAAAGDNVMIQGVYFSVNDPETVIATARANAIDNAHKRAGEYAAAAGVAVGGVMQISEISVSPMPMYYAGAADSGVASGRAAAPTPIQTGTQDLSVNVTVVYAIG